MASAVLLGGPHHRLRATLAATPSRVQVDPGGVIYSRVDDPDTGEYLGGYAFVSKGD